MYLLMCGKRKNNFVVRRTSYVARRNTQYGFTLIELLLAVTIFSIVASVIYSSFRLGIISWRRTEANLSRYQKIKYAINRFTEDITNAFMYKDIPFTSEEGRVEFAGFIKDIETKQGNIGKISYFLLNETGTRSSGKLIRQELPYWQAIEAVEEEGGETAASAGEEMASASEELLSDVIDFSINYCYKMPEEETAELEWLPEWVSEEAIPAGIRLELVLKDDYALAGKREFIKRIHIPAGEIGNLEELEGAE